MAHHYASHAGSSIGDFDRAVGWLVSAQNHDGGWGGDVATPSSIEETAFAVEALASLLPSASSQASGAKGSGKGLGLAEATVSRARGALTLGVRWLEQATVRGKQFPPTPIGFYFAKLWYYERLYPLISTVAALSRVAALTDSLPDETTARQILQSSIHRGSLPK